MCNLCSRKIFEEKGKPIRIGTLVDEYRDDIDPPKGHCIRIFESKHVAIEHGKVLYRPDSNEPVNYLMTYDYDAGSEKRNRLIAAQIFYCPICGEKL